MRADRTARSVWIQFWCNLLSLDLVQERSEQFPSRLKFVVANEETLVAVDDVQNQTLVRIRQFGGTVRVLVLKIQNSLVETLTQTWNLVIDSKVNGFVWLDTNDELIRDVFDASLAFTVEVTRGVTELDA